MTIAEKIQRSSQAALLGLALHFATGYALGTPFLTDSIAEWIMARTPSAYAVPLLEVMGEWAKPFAATGGLATLGFLLFLPLLFRSRPIAMVFGVVMASLLGRAVDYESNLGALAFWLPAWAWILTAKPKPAPQVAAPKAGPTRRELVSSVVMSSGTLAVAGEAWWRNRRFASRAVDPRPLYSYSVPQDALNWGQGLVRKPLTPLREFYVMSKNTVDPAPDPATWRLRIKLDDKTLREFTYAELLSLPRTERFVSLRCVSNSLKSDLMGTASWSGISLEQLVRRTEIPSKAIEMAVIGLDGHGDSYKLDYAFSGEPLFALGMNGETLNRLHGFPIRMLSPRYYGFKSIKWLDEIRFSSTPYFGTWPKLGYTKEPIIHTGTFIDRIVAKDGLIRAGGIGYAGGVAIEQVQVRIDGGAWVEAKLEPRLSQYTFTRWTAELPRTAGEFLEARARDASGQWQSAVEKPLFPDGVSGPTRKRLPTA